MTLVEQAERLKALTENVEAAADKERAARAIDAVRTQMNIASNAVMGHGVVPEHAQDVPEHALLEVQDRARSLADVLGPLDRAEDAVLVAYGANQDATTTGVLASVTKRARELGAALRDAQRHVLVAWAERLWPGADLARLEALAAIEPSAKVLLRLRTELLATDAQDRSVTATEMQRLAARVDAAQEAAADVHDTAPPLAVIAFYERLERSTDGVPLSEVDAFVLQWLVDHAADELRLQRSGDT